MSGEIMSQHLKDVSHLHNVSELGALGPGGQRIAQVGAERHHVLLHVHCHLAVVCHLTPQQGSVSLKTQSSAKECSEYAVRMSEDHIAHTPAGTVHGTRYSARFAEPCCSKLCDSKTEAAHFGDAAGGLAESGDGALHAIADARGALALLAPHQARHHRHRLIHPQILSHRGTPM